MLKQISYFTTVFVIGMSHVNAQPSPNLDGIFVDQKLYRTCMASRRNEGFCSCMADVSIKNIKGPKFKEIWFAFQASGNTNEAERLRSQLTPAENQILNKQLQAADNAQDACNARFGVR